MSGLSEEDRARVEEILPFVEGSVRWSALTRLLATIDTLTRELDEARVAPRASTEGEGARNFEEVVLDGDRFLVPAAVARALAPATHSPDGGSAPTASDTDVCSLDAAPSATEGSAATCANRDESSTEGGARVEKPRMALRPYHDDPERLDDVVVEDVAMFRAEMMDDGHLWMACYFDKNGTAPDLHFSVMAGKTGRAQLHLSATDVPPHIDIDADEPAQSDTPTDQEDTP